MEPDKNRFLYGTCNFFTALRLATSPRRSYPAVVLASEWPISFCTVTRSTLASSRSPAKVRLVNSAGTTQATSYYYPFGGNRGAAFSTLTTKRFTGQYHESTLPGGEGLSYYNARWYDAKLGRFISADTIVPSPQNPQSLNRYAYVVNNPLKYVDPSGHRECVDDGCNLVIHPVSERISVRSGNFYNVAQNIVNALGGINDLEAMSTIVEIGALLYPEWENFLPEMGNVFIGTRIYGTGALISAGVFGSGCSGVGREPRDCPGNIKYFSDTGFHPDFQDGHNQPYHVWGYIAQTATPGNVLKLELNLQVASWANLVHEIAQSKLNMDDGWGTSWQDFVLSQAGMRIGYEISYGLVASPAELGDTLRRELGSQGFGSYGKLHGLEDQYGPLRGSP